MLLPACTGKEITAEARTRTDAEGQFHLKIPPLGRMFVNGVNFLAYRPGSGHHGEMRITRRPYRLVLRKPEPRTVKIEGPDGKPIAGARVAPRVLYVFGGATAEIPESLAAPLAVITGPDGRATINYLAARDQLVAVRVAADPIGTQDILLVERPGQGSVEPVITIKLKKTSRLAGRIVDGAGQPVAGQVVEVWSRGDGSWLGPNTVELRGGPLRTAADGRSRPRTTSWSARRIASRSEPRARSRSSPTGSRSATQPRALLPMMIAAVADRQRPGGRSPGQAGRECRGLPDRATVRSKRRPRPTPTAGFPWAAFGRGRCSCSRAARGSGSTGS